MDVYENFFFSFWSFWDKLVIVPNIWLQILISDTKEIRPTWRYFNYFIKFKYTYYRVFSAAFAGSDNWTVWTNKSRIEEFHFGDLLMFHVTQWSQMGAGARLVCYLVPYSYLVPHLWSGTPSTVWYPVYYLVSYLLSGVSSTIWYTIHVWYSHLCVVLHSCMVPPLRLHSQSSTLPWPQPSNLVPTSIYSHPPSFKSGSWINLPYNLTPTLSTSNLAYAPIWPDSPLCQTRMFVAMFISISPRVDSI